MIEPVDTLLTGWTAPGVWAAAALPPDIAARAQDFGWLPMVAEHDVASKSDFLEAIRLAASFPAWVGHNWDAFEDAITDLSWLPPEPVLLVLAAPIPDTAVDILVDAARFWDRHHRSFAVIVTGTSLDGRAEALPRLDRVPIVGQRPPIRLTGQ